MPLEYPARHDRRAPRLPRATPSCSTCRTSARCGSPAPARSTALQRALTNDLGKIAPGRAQYTHLLDDADGSVLDDIIVWWHPRATTSRRVRRDAQRVEHRPRARRDRRRRDDRTSRAVLAVQGPAALDRLADGVPRGRRGRPLPGRRGGVERRRRARSPAPATRASAGVEIAVPAAAAADLWEAIVGAGVKPAGLGARDTLRLEAGLPLHGHELGPGITPLQAGLGWVVAWDKPEFRGRDAVARRARRAASPAASSASPPRAGARRGPSAPCSSTATGVGEVTSGNFSPVLGHGIALAFVPPDVAEGTRGRRRRPRHRAARHRRADAVRPVADQRAGRGRRPSSLRRCRLLGRRPSSWPRAALLGRRLLRRRRPASRRGASGPAPAAPPARGGDAASGRGCAGRTARRPARRAGPAATAAGTGR